MSPNTKKIIAGIVLTLLPVSGVQLARQTAWAKFVATPKARQLGDPHAKVILVEYSDFQCPMCARVQPTLHAFMETYKGKVRLAFKYFPLSRIHRNSMSAAHAAECAAEQDKFWPYQDALFETQAEWATLANPTTSYLAIAKKVQLDLDRFKSCDADPAKEATIEQDHAEGEARQITATPTLFINEQRLVGSFISSDGARTIEKELRK